MSWKQIGLSLVLADFLGLSAYAVYQHGYIGFFEAVTANAATTTAFADMAIALSMVVVWMWQDARDRGVSPLPYVVLTATLGSVGPLLYLIRREASERARPLGAPAHAR